MYGIDRVHLHGTVHEPGLLRLDQHGRLHGYLLKHSSPPRTRGRIVRLAQGPVHVRAPTRPIETVESVYAADDLFTAVHAALTPGVRAALLVASPDLHAALAELDDPTSDPARRARIALRVLAYVVRMGSRTTPFGSFAGVGLAEPGETTSLALRTSRRRTVSRFDAQWIFRHVAAAADRAFAAGTLHVQFSDAVIAKGDRLFVIADPRLDAESDSLGEAALRSVKRSAALDLIRALAATPVAVRELTGTLTATFALDDASAFAYVRSLRESGFLIAAVAPDPTRDPIALALAFLAGEDTALTANLDAVRALCAEMDAAFGDAGLAHVPAVARAAASLGTTLKEMLQVDVVVPSAGTIGRNVLDAAERYAELMLRGGRDLAAERHREIFREAFEGHERLVPLLEFVEATLSIRSSKPLSAANDAQADAARCALLGELAARAAAGGAISVTLTPDDIETLYPPVPETARLPRSLGVGIQVFAGSAEEIDRGRFLIRPTDVAVRNKHSVVARFAGALGLSLAGDEDEDDGAVEVELVYAPLHPRMTNVLARPPATRYEIAPGLPVPAHRDGAPIRLPLGDVFVGLDETRGLYLKSESLAREVRIRQTHMLSWQKLAPPVGYVLAVIAEDGRRVAVPFHWGPLDLMRFKPRIVHDRIVLSPATWRVGAAALGSGAVSAETFAGRVRELRAALRVPRYVSLYEGDNKLLLDLDSPWGVALLRDRSRAKEEIVLEEAAPSPSETWVRGDDGRYAVELIVGFDLAVPERAVRRPVTFGTRAERLAAPAEWLYLQLFAARETFDTLLRTALGPCAESAGARVWFFVRYGDADAHLRFRLKLDGGAARREVLRTIDGLLNDGLIRRYAVTTYEREIERYGGAAALERWERLFAVSSRRSLARIARREPNEARIEGAVRDALTLARDLLTDRERAELLAIVRERAPRRTSSAADRTLLRALRTVREAGEAERPDTEIAAIVAELRALAERELLTKPLPLALASWLHVHCNRLALFGEEETRVNVLFAKALFARYGPHPAPAPGAAAR